MSVKLGLDIALAVNYLTAAVVIDGTGGSGGTDGTDKERFEVRTL